MQTILHSAAMDRSLAINGKSWPLKPFTLVYRKKGLISKAQVSMAPWTLKGCVSKTWGKSFRLLCQKQRHMKVTAVNQHRLCYRLKL